MILKFNSDPKPAHLNLSAETPPSSKAARTSVLTAPGGIVLRPMPPTLHPKPLTNPSIDPDLAPGRRLLSLLSHGFMFPGMTDSSF